MGWLWMLGRFWRIEMMMQVVDVKSKSVISLVCPTSC
jgi:hypothetical protein